MEFRVPFARFIYFVLVSGLLALSAVPRVKRCASIMKFCVNVKQPVTFFSSGNSQPNFIEFWVNSEQYNPFLSFKDLSLYISAWLWFHALCHRFAMFGLKEKTFYNFPQFLQFPFNIFLYFFRRHMPQISTIVLVSPVKMEQLVSTPWMITLVIVLMATLERTAALVRIQCVCFRS